MLPLPVAVSVIAPAVVLLALILPPIWMPPLPVVSVETRLMLVPAVIGPVVLMLKPEVAPVFVSAKVVPEDDAARFSSLVPMFLMFTVPAPPVLADNVVALTASAVAAPIAPVPIAPVTLLSVIVGAVSELVPAEIAPVPPAEIVMLLSAVRL